MSDRTPRFQRVAILNEVSLTESSGANQEAYGKLLDDLGNGRVPGFAASEPDGDGEADELQGQGLEIATHVEASPGAIGEAGDVEKGGTEGPKVGRSGDGWG